MNTNIKCNNYLFCNNSNINKDYCNDCREHIGTDLIFNLTKNKSQLLQICQLCSKNNAIVYYPSCKRHLYCIKCMKEMIYGIEKHKDYKYIYYSLYFFDFILYKNIDNIPISTLFTPDINIYNISLLYTIIDIIKYIKKSIKDDAQIISINDILNGNKLFKNFNNKYKRNVLEMYQFFYEKNLSKNKDFISCSVYESSLEYQLYSFYRMIKKDWYDKINILYTKYLLDTKKTITNKCPLCKK